MQQSIVGPFIPTAIDVTQFVTVVSVVVVLAVIGAYHLINDVVRVLERGVRARRRAQFRRAADAAQDRRRRVGFDHVVRLSDLSRRTH